ncbi:MAG: tRNA (adenosine(37)-N6)-threonylcarbamoyltransferase complex dimerization subunit type 1 TsaB, partial [Anaerovoracaceae bacterium]
ETTGPYCSVAILDHEENITEVSGKDVLNHLQTLTPMIQQALEECQLQLSDIDVIAVSVGPGSFTGIRIGVSTARALSQVTGIKLMEIPTLLAFGCSQGEAHQVVCPIFDARRNQVYAGAYRNFEELVPGGPYLLDEFLEKLEGYDDLVFMGDGLKAYGEAIKACAGERKITFIEESQRAGAVCEMARDLLSVKPLLDYNDLEPNYMRLPEAERKLKEKSGGK